MRLFCIPYAGGSPVVFDDWEERLARTVSVAPICLPGRAMRSGEPPVRRLVPLADQLADELSGQLDRPFALLGHSMGGLLAFELVRALRHRGAPEPSLLVASAVRAAHLPLPHRPLYKLTDEQLIARVTRYGHVPAQLRRNRYLLKLFLPALRADLEAYETYVHEPESPLDVPILAIGADQDPLVPTHTLAEWDMHTTAGCRVRVLRGNHFFLHTSRAAMLRLLDDELQAVTATGGRG